MLHEYIPENLRVTTGYLLVLFMLGLVFSSFTFGFWYFASGRNEYKSSVSLRQISVNGEGRVAIKPDVAEFSATVVSDAKKIKDAQTENANKSNAILDYVKKQRIQDKDIKTVGYSIFPQYQYIDAPCEITLTRPCTRRPPEIVSYQVRHTFEIRVRDLGKIDDLLDGVVSSGANEVSSVSFTVDNPDAARADARKKAIEHAKEKAEVLARDLGVRLGGIMSFSESGGGIVPMFGRMALSETAGMSAKSTVPQVALGEQEIISSVTIIYEFR